MIAESGLKIKIVRKIEEISIHDWNKVFPDAVESYYFFKTLDESNLSQFSFFYILVYDNDTPVGATSCFIMDFPLDIAVTGKLKRITNFIKGLFPSILNPRILLCGLPNERGRIGIVAEPEIALKAIYKGMEQIARQEKAGIIVFKDFDLSYGKILDKCLDYGFFKVDSLPSTEMDIHFANFDEYLKTLSYISRSGLRRKFRKIDGKVKIDLEITNKPEEGVLDEAYALYLQTYERQEVGLERVPVDFFKNISKNMPDEAKFFLWRIDNKIAAFTFSLVSGGCFIDYYLGFDYSVAYRYHLYFVRFRDLMNWCIENKIRKYEFGPTGYESKRRLGFNFIPLYNYVKHRNKLLNPVFKIFSNLLVKILYTFFSKRGFST